MGVRFAPGTQKVGSHSGQLHEFRKLEGVIPTQVQILYPPQRLMKKDTTILISVACLFKESKGKKYWLLIKPSEDLPWELPKATVRKGESSVRAILRIMGELAGMSVKVLEEVGRASATITINNRSVPQKIIYYLLVFKASAGEVLGFEDAKWLENAKAVKEVASKKEASRLREAKQVLAKWEKEHYRNR